jgi:hypothetical protein
LNHQKLSSQEQVFETKKATKGPQRNSFIGLNQKSFDQSKNKNVGLKRAFYNSLRI